MGLDANKLETCFFKLKLDNAKNKNLAIDEAAIREKISIGGLTWFIFCFPHGVSEDQSDNGEYMSLRVVMLEGTVRAIFHVFVIRSDGAPSVSHPNSTSQFISASDGTESWVIGRWRMKRSELESNYLVDGCITFICGITTLSRDSSISVPASDLGNHLGNLLDCTDGADVSFSVGGETFRAHRAVLAARSPVFKAQLLGSMADAKMNCITLHDMQPATFEALLRFMYTDALPIDNDLDNSSATELLQHLLAAADMYHLGRLKLVCAQKLCDRLSIDNVATILGCAETHNCSELKSRCTEFFMVGKNFKKAVLTEGYLRLMQSFPSIIDEIRARLET